MKKRAIFFILLSCLALWLCTSVFSETVADLLGWRLGIPPGEQKSNLCGGYYSEPEDIASSQNPPPFKTTRIIITAKGPTIFRTNGESILQQDVIIRQPGRIIHADKATVYRDGKTGHITHIQLAGHVRVQEKGKLLAGETATFDVANNIFTINHVAYHITGAHKLIVMQMPINAWGTADSLRHLDNGVSELTNATYSTCSPMDPDWMISAKSMHLDPHHNKGSAKDVVIRFKKIPIFYSPYYSFPINAVRKSGLLTPTAGYATDHGFYMTLPYYWNIAPNYDLLFTPEWYSERGVQFHHLFRYLTDQSEGQLYTSFIPKDRKFAEFRQKTLDSFDGKSIPSDLSPYLSALRKNSSNRGFLDFENNTAFNNAFQSKVALRYVTDPYFPRDFESEYLNDNTNQLPSFAELDYQGSHWNGALLFQTYQTLHSLDHYTTPAQNQYTRLPEIDVSGTYPDVFNGFNANVNAQIVHFIYHSVYFPYTYQRPIGDRIHAEPSLSYPMTWAAGYITPQFVVDSTHYFSKTPAADVTALRPTFNVNRTLPIIDVDSGLYFDHSIQFRGQNYIQTLEPRFFYLYTPYLNQDAYPNFDTQMLPFSFSDLYSINRFTGFDRLQNADQFSLGLTSRILSTVDAADILTSQFGFITYFENPRVCLLPGCQITNRVISPVTGSLTFNPNPIWSLTSGIAWDTTLHQINNAETGVEYHFDNHRIALLNYQFTHGNPDTPFESLGFSTNSSLLKAGLLWPVSDRWRLFGYTYYNLTQQHLEDEYVGLAYETCCFAVRAIIQNNYDGTQQINGGSVFQNRYTTNYFIEFLFKGLGSAGNRSAESMLTSTLPGFQDIFSNKHGYGYTDQL